MAREIISWCDVCMEESNGDVRERGEEMTIAVGNYKPRLLSICESHNKMLLAPLVELLRSLPIAEGAAVGAGGGSLPPSVQARREPIEGGLTCQMCGSTLKNRGSFGSHVRQMHGITLTEYRDRFERDSQTTTPATPDQGSLLEDDGEVPPSQIKSEVRCDLCDWVGMAIPSRVNQTLGVHKSKIHGIKGTAKTTR